MSQVVYKTQEQRLKRTDAILEVYTDRFVEKCGSEDLALIWVLQQDLTEFSVSGNISVCVPQPMSPAVQHETMMGYKLFPYRQQPCMHVCIVFNCSKPRKMEQCLSELYTNKASALPFANSQCISAISISKTQFS